MGPLKIPPGHVYCVQAGKKHYELFTTTYVGTNYCGHCGQANPFRPQHRARSKTPALPARPFQNSKANTRKPTRHRTGYQWVHISLLLVGLETKYFNGLAVEVPETVLPLKDTVIKFSSVDLLTWPSFTAILFHHLRPLLPTIDITNRDLWSLSYASGFSGKKIVTVPNTDKYTTPSSMLASGHFFLCGAWLLSASTFWLLPGDREARRLSPPQSSVPVALSFSPARVFPKDARLWLQLLAILEDMDLLP
ncbi:hypothetical protein EDB81DRAFT_895588 [Dactylonectria macrodidyma]|uniref:Uncharacterized protein n=1 Tax=Dactylonectria macrodidyma TaxID=307937 RepID=A0A9P9JMI2_9HYPO|nr:hypothetical protein EDB81DRAFT_895588 [Dactylonectria macrodidyma]